ncbi:MAG: phytanoyl-CoA hydroxylase [Kiritimatiellia bacterium]|jgi:phytanoyl-CoA hydroxylase
MSAAAVSLFAEPLTDSIQRDGYAVIRGAVSQESIDSMIGRVGWLCDRITQSRWSSPYSSSLGQHLARTPRTRELLDRQVRVPRWLHSFALQPGIVDSMHDLLGPQVQMLRHVELDIAPPQAPDPRAIWHQDHFYVRNCASSLMAWIPLQDTSLREGLLQVMPGSHRLGALPHNNVVNGDQHYPDDIFDRAVRMIPVRRGDLVIMTNHLVQAQGPNLSPATRWVVRARFVPKGSKVDSRHADLVNVDGLERVQ